MALFQFADSEPTAQSPRIEMTGLELPNPVVTDGKNMKLMRAHQDEHMLRSLAYRSATASKKGAAPNRFPPEAG